MRTVVVMCVALLSLLTGCGSAPSPAGAPTVGAPTSPAAGPLDFRGTTVDGAAFDGASLHGTPVVLWFWAPY